jgi:hypothetical protein
MATGLNLKYLLRGEIFSCKNALPMKETLAGHHDFEGGKTPKKTDSGFSPASDLSPDSVFLFLKATGNPSSDFSS